MKIGSVFQGLFLHSWNFSRKSPTGLSLAILLALAWSCSKPDDARGLAFSKTTAFRPKSIPARIEAIRKLGRPAFVHHAQASVPIQSERSGETVPVM